MPVTARLSSRFYEKFGDDIAAEFVNWFNDVDATYRGDLRQLNELNFARFDARVGERFAELEARLDRRLADLELRWERRLAEVEANWKRRFSELDGNWERRFTDLAGGWERRFGALEGFWEQRLSDVRAELIRWMFVFWAGNVATTLAIVLALR
jgi:hypothetical protein